MRFFVIPLGWLTRTLRHGAVRVLGENEARSLENDIVQPRLSMKFMRIPSKTRKKGSCENGIRMPEYTVTDNGGEAYEHD